MLSAQDLANILNGFGIYAVMGSLLTSIAVAVLGILPSVFLTGANILVFGPYKGFFISWLGEVLGALAAFYLYRWGFKKRSEGFANRNPLLLKLTKAGGCRAGLLVFQARILPFIPSGLVTLAAAVSNITLQTYISATALGKVPSLLLEAVVSYDIINIEENVLRLVIILLLVVTFYIYFKVTKHAAE